MKTQKLKVVAHFPRPAAADWSWVDQRQYRLDAITPSLQWLGFDASEPDGVRVDMNATEVAIYSEIYLADACSKPDVFQFRLVKK